MQLLYSLNWKFLTLFTSLWYITLSSKFYGVYWHNKSGKWRAVLSIRENGKRIQKEAGTFENELTAAKALNQLCDQYGMQHKNLELNGIPQEKVVREINKRQYCGVYYRGDNIKNHWEAFLILKNERIRGGVFLTPEKAAKQVNAMCKRYGLKKKNPELSSDDEVEVKKRNMKASKYYGVGWLKRIENSKKPWTAHLRIDGKKQFFGNFETEANAAKHINKICKQLGWSKKNEDLSSSEDEQADTLHNKRKRESKNSINSDVKQ